MRTKLKRITVHMGQVHDFNLCHDIPVILCVCFQIMRKIRKHLVYDVLHKTVVTGLIGLTGIGCGLLAWRGYRYLTCEYTAVPHGLRPTDVSIRFY